MSYRPGTQIGIGLKRANGFLCSRLDRLIERMGLNLPEALKRALHIFTDEDAVVDASSLGMILAYVRGYLFGGEE